MRFLPNCGRIVRDRVEFRDNALTEALPKIINALQIASLFSRERVFQVLNASLYWFTYIDNGETLWQIYQAVEEVEQWWSFEETLKALEARLIPH